MLAGTAVRDRVLEQLNDLGNLVNLESNGHIAYDNIRWGIEARNEDGTVGSSSLTCFDVTHQSQGEIHLQESSLFPCKRAGIHSFL